MDIVLMVLVVSNLLIVAYHYRIKNLTTCILCIASVVLVNKFGATINIIVFLMSVGLVNKKIKNFLKKTLDK